MTDLQNLIDVATGKIMHRYNGECPDHLEGWDVRDDECDACQIIVAAEREQSAPAAVLPDPLSLTDAEAESFRAAMRYSQPTPTAEPSVPATDLPQLRYSADLHAGRLRARVRELPDSYRRDAALMTEAADQLEYLSRAELDNHHAADMCPYCTPDPAHRRRDQVDVDELMHELFPERQGDDRG